MDMEYGWIINKLKIIQVVTRWIKRRDLEYTNGLGNNATRGNLERIIEKDMEDFMNYLLNSLPIPHNKAEYLMKK